MPKDNVVQLHEVYTEKQRFEFEFPNETPDDHEDEIVLVFNSPVTGGRAISVNRQTFDAFCRAVDQAKANVVV